MSGKGDRQRPTDKEAFDRNFDTIFGQKKLGEKIPPSKKGEQDGDVKHRPGG